MRFRPVAGTGRLCHTAPVTRSVPTVRLRCEWFRAGFLAILLTEYWCRALAKWGDLNSLYANFALPAATILCLVGFNPRWSRLAMGGLAGVQAIVLWSEFPAAGNHAYLELLLCLLLALLDIREHEDSETLLYAVPRLWAIILTYSGVQKLAHGFYFGGELLAYSLQTNSFRPVLEWLMPAPEFARLTALTGQVGDGPYTVESGFFRVVSNTIWISELVLGPLLLLPAAAQAAAVATAILLLGIELGAREVFFGLVFSNGLALWFPAQQRQWTYALAAILGTLLLSRIGVLPAATFY